jgi:arabinofuranosyltransferase
LIEQERMSDPYRQTKIIPILAAIFLLTIFIFLAVSNSFLCDDAFITFRFSRHLTNGIGPVYNIGERVEGYTNFFWMLLMAIVIKLGGSPQLWSRIFSACFSCGTLILFMRHIYRNNSGGRVIGFIFALFLVLSAPFISWSSGGLETAAFAFFLFAATLLYIAAVNREEGRFFVISSFLFSIAALTRPEGVFAFGLAVGYLLLLLIFKKNSRWQFAEFSLPFTILYGLYFVWRFSYYGKLFPNTFYIKEPSSLLIPLGIQYYQRFLIGCPVWLPLLLAVYLAIRSRFRGLSHGDYFMVILCLLFSSYIIYVGGDFMDHWRFIMPLLAPFYLLIYHLGRGQIPFRPNKFEIAVALVILIIFAAINLGSISRSRDISYDYNVDSMGALRNYVTQWTSVGKLLSEIGQPGDTIAITAAGIIPYYTDMYAIDMYGLEAADLSKYNSLREFTRPGHRMTISLKYLYDNKPHFMIAHPLITEGQPRYFPYSQAQDLYPTLLKEYTAISMAMPDLPGYYLNFRVRNDIIGRISKEIKTYKVDYWSQ